MMAELAERARRVRESIMDRTRSDGVVPTTAQLCQDLGLSRADLAEDLKNLEAAFSVARQDAAHAELKQFQGEVLDEPLPPLSEIMYARPFAAPRTTTRSGWMESRNGMPRSGMRDRVRSPTDPRLPGCSLLDGPARIR
jgi:DNA-binding transcriptional MocR family regulator